MTADSNSGQSSGPGNNAATEGSDGFLINIPPEDITAEKPSRPVVPLWKSWLQLLRIPAVFTAWADICAGYLLTHNPWGLPAADARGELHLFLLLLTASSGLYLAGMLWNDYFDLAIDREDRPNRPLPSGRISLSAAYSVGVCLVLIGLGASASIGLFWPNLWRWNPLIIATLITMSVFAYDRLLKQTIVGPVAMGLCRFFNILLGASCSGIRWTGPFQQPQLWIAAAMAVYICGVTWFARTEAKDSHRLSLAGASVVINAGLAILFAWAWTGIISVDPKHASLLFGVIAITINRRLITAMISPTPAVVQGGVRMMLISIIPIHCAVIYAQHNRIDFATILAIFLLIPTFTLGSLIRMT
ncbi:MAG: UbiA family prenyltransferase [Planctomycetaceae bacterium]